MRQKHKPYSCSIPKLGASDFFPNDQVDGIGSLKEIETGLRWEAIGNLFLKEYNVLND